MRIPIVSLLLAASLLASHCAEASTIADVVMKCPIDGKSFTTTTAMSGTQFGTHLDLKPYGPILAPWPIAKCPDNGMVIYKQDFTPEEIERLKVHVLGEEYQALQKTETNYYLAANLMKHMGASPDSIAFALLRSTWEAESDARYGKYATETLLALETAMAQPASDLDPNDALLFQQLAGEMERRLGRFDAAAKRFAELMESDGAKGNTLEKVIAQEMALIAARDSATHQFSDKQP